VSLRRNPFSGSALFQPCSPCSTLHALRIAARLMTSQSYSDARRAIRPAPRASGTFRFREPLSTRFPSWGPNAKPQGDGHQCDEIEPRNPLPGKQHGPFPRSPTWKPTPEPQLMSSEHVTQSEPTKGTRQTFVNPGQASEVPFPKFVASKVPTTMIRCDAPQTRLA
jgi:hypothetical protein